MTRAGLPAEAAVVIILHRKLPGRYNERLTIFMRYESHR
jgi:hypothetical protein